MKSAVESKLKLYSVSPYAGLPFQDPIYKIYHDGSHYVASRVIKKQWATKRQRVDLMDMDLLFDTLYFEAVKQNLKRQKLFEYIKQELQIVYPEFTDLDSYIENRIKYKLHLLYLRKKRFRRKAYLNNWTHFVTFTYDDKLCDEHSFMQRLRRCLSNLHTRYGWRYMGAFERSPEDNRLHFHGIFYIPDGKMVGNIKVEHYFSIKKNKMCICFNNTFFKKRFGRADFRSLNDEKLRNGEAILYILKYIQKDDGRIIYSRGIASEICKLLPDQELAAEFTDFIAKYVLFDNTINWEKDIMHFRPKQLSFFYRC